MSEHRTQPMMELSSIDKNSYLSKFRQGSLKSYWQELVQRFTDKINAERKEAGYKPLPYKVIAIKLGDAKMSYWDCERFYKQCEQAKCPFGAAFFHSLKSVDKE